MFGSELNLVTTVIGFGMSATFIVFVCARLICGRIRSADSQADISDIGLRSDLEAREQPVTVMEAVAVAAIPTVKFSRELFNSAEDAQCSICLGDYEEKEILRVMPACHHNFHLACIDLWLHKQSTCPICRLPVNNTLEVSPMFSMDSLEFSSDRSSQWLLPSHQQSERTETSQQIHNSVSVDIEGQHSEQETGT